MKEVLDMNIYLMVDAEGLCGIHLASQVMPDGCLYQEFRRMMTEEVNVCVEGLKAGGVSRIMVRDAHASGNNVLWPLLTALADGCVMGNSCAVRMPGLEECDAVVLLGYHAMAGTGQAVLEHTMSSRHWQNFWINGRKCGEIAIDAAVAGTMGKPVILVSGDDKACAEAELFLPGVVTAAVKKGLSAEGAIHLPKERAYELIRRQAAAAIKKAEEGGCQPFRIDSPVTLRLELTERGQIPNPAARPDIRQIDGRTYEVTAETVEIALSRL
jgi:D-amino peptidase